MLRIRHFIYLISSSHVRLGLITTIEEFFKLTNFNSFNFPHKEKRGEGILIYVKQLYNACELKLGFKVILIYVKQLYNACELKLGFKVTSFECGVVNIVINNTKQSYVICGIYKLLNAYLPFL